MHVVGSFIEDLTRTQVLERASSYLHLYFAVQYIHDRVGVMTVNGVYGSRSKVDHDDLDLPAPGCSGIGFVRSGVTFCAIAVEANSEASINTRRFFILLIPSNIVRLRDDHQRRPLDADCGFPYRRA
jgi:hypothetical protein